MDEEKDPLDNLMLLLLVALIAMNVVYFWKEYDTFKEVVTRPSTLPIDAYPAEYMPLDMEPITKTQEIHKGN